MSKSPRWRSIGIVLAAALTVWILAAFGLGIFVAYAAMFGFDKFKEAFEKLKSEKK